MNFGYTIIYVPSPDAALTFYESAFGFQRRFLSEEGDYGELDTGATTLSFASETLAEHVFSGGYHRHRPESDPFAYEIGFTTDDVAAAVAKAVAAGASLVLAPEVRPWGQTVAYVRDLNGVLVEICTPMSD